MPVQLVVNGGLGRAVAGPLGAALARCGHVAGTGPDAALGILVADQDDPLLIGFAETCRAAQVPSLVVVQQHPEVRIGPLDVPGTELCATCFRLRAQQHGRDLGVPGGQPCEDPLAVSVDGYPPYLVALVVALAVQRLSVLDHAPAHGGNEVT